MWKEHPLKIARDHSAIVAENEYGVLIDLTLCADAMWNNIREPETCKDKHYYDSQTYRYIVWSSISSDLVGVVAKLETGFKLTLVGFGFEEKVSLENVIKIAAEEYQYWIRGSLDPSPNEV